MEGVPRLPMLSFELKTCSEPIEFTPALKSYISEVYHENPDSYSKECAELDQLRQSCIKVTTDFMGCSLLKKYYAQLHFLQSRFPLKNGDPIMIPFTWEDVYSRDCHVASDVMFEMACILYNIGSLHSILGSMDNRTSAEGMKVSCTHFQCAAWAFQHLRDSFETNASQDMNYHLLSFKFYLMLAQAQECILEKSMTDNRKSSITAKVSAQIVEYYKLAIKSLDASNSSSYAGSKKTKEWKKRMDLKINFYECITFLYLGMCSEEQQKWGERITYYQAAVDRLKECAQLNGKSDSDFAAIEESLRFAMDVAGGKLNAAKKDNDFIYHEKIPALDALPEVKGASLVKGIPFNHTDPEISGPDIFRKLVPMEAHKASSLYSEEKAKLLRQTTAKIEEKNQELSQFMSSLQLESVTQIVPEPQKLPPALVEKCAAISVRPDAIKTLIDAMQSLSGISLDVEGNLNEIRNLLEQEDRKQKEFQAVYGSVGQLKAGAALGDLRSECSRCQEGLTKASQSNEELHRAMEIHIANLRLLTTPLNDLQKALPSIADLQRTADDEATVKEMKRLYDKVSEMKTQRQQLEQQLREELLKDDITAALVTQGDNNQDEFFQEQLKKHSKTVEYIDHNLYAQDNILRALTDVNAKFARIRKENNDVTTRRNAKVLELIQSYDVYEDLMTKTNKGVQFYGKLDTTVKKLLERSCSLCQACDEERAKLLEKLAPKAPPPARPTAPKPGQANPLPFDGVLTSLPANYPELPPSLNSSYVPASLPSLEPQPLRLKDFLPLMKPATFGPKAAAGGSHSAASATAATQSGSLPPSVSMSPVHFAHSAAAGSLPASPHRQPLQQPAGAPYGNDGQEAAAAAAAAGQGNAGYVHRSGPEMVHSTGQLADQWSASAAMLNQPNPTTQNPSTQPPAQMSGYVNPQDAWQFNSMSMPATALVGSTYGSNGPTSNVSSMPSAVDPRSFGAITSVPNSSTFPQSVSSHAAQLPTNPTHIHQQQQFITPGSRQSPVHSAPPETSRTPVAGSVPPSYRMAVGNNDVAYSLSSVNAPSSAPSSLPQQQQLPSSIPSLQGSGMHAVSQPYASYQHRGIPAFDGMPLGYQIPGQVASVQHQQVMQSQYQPPSQVLPTSTVTANQNVANVRQPQQQSQTSTGQLQQQQSFAPTYAATMPTTANTYASQALPGSPAAAVQQFNVAPHPNQASSAPVGGQSVPFAPYGGQAPIRYPAAVGSPSHVPTGNVGNLRSNQPNGGPNMLPNVYQMPSNSSLQTLQHSVNQPQAGGYQANYPGNSANQPQHGYQATSMPSATAGDGGLVHSQQSMGYRAPSVQPVAPMATVSSGTYTQSQQPAGYQQPSSLVNSFQHPITLPYQHQQQPVFPPSATQAGAMQHVSNPNQPIMQPYQQQHQQPVLPPSATQVGAVQHMSNPNQPIMQPYQQQQQQQQPVVPPSATQVGAVQHVNSPNQPLAHQAGLGAQAMYQANSAQYGGAAAGLMQQSSAQGVVNPVASPYSVSPEALPHSLPSPLQPNRVNISSAPAKSVNLESLKDLELSTKSTGAADDSSSAAPNNADASPLVPKVVSSEEQRERREEELRRSLQKSRTTQDPFVDPDTLSRFEADVEKFQKLVDALVKPTLGGYLPLDKEWKDLNDEQEKSVRQYSMAIARCYPLKNRFPDVMPFDNSRVLLTGAADDYINASHLVALSSSCPNFIATQSPLPTTFADFWQMVYDQGAETIVSLCVEQEAGVKNHIYWPAEKNQSQHHGQFIVSLQSVKDKSSWIERIFSVTHKATNQSRPVIHLQFLLWPPAGIPESVESLIQFVVEVQSFYLQQRSLTKPVIVHCSNGVGRTGAFCVIYAGIDGIDMNGSIVQIPELVSQLRRQRRNLVHYKEQLKFCYDAVLFYAQDLLRRRGLLKSSFAAGKLPSVGDRTHTRAPSDDLILGVPSLSTIQSSVSKMTIRSGSTRSSTDSSFAGVGAVAVAASNVSGAEQPPDSLTDSALVSPVDVMSSSRQTEQHSRSVSPTLSTCSGSSAALSPQHQLPAVLADTKLAGGNIPSLSNLPLSLADLQNPATFRIDPSPSTKRKITKASFFDPSRPSLGGEDDDGSDPLGKLDPLWSLKSANKECSTNGKS